MSRKASIIRYIGKRSLNLDYEKEAFKFDCYCEPFSGSFNSGIELMKSGYNTHYIINDLDRKIYNLWECIKDKPDQTYRKVEEILKEVNNAKDIEEKRYILYLASENREKATRAASEYVYRLISSLSGIDRKPKELRYTLKDFRNQSRLLDELDAEIYNLDYAKMIQIMNERYGSRAFFYIDPPYAVENVGDYYRCDSEHFNHDKLKSIVDNIEGKFIMTYNNSEYIRNLYKDYHQYVISKFIFGRRYTELVITNYDKPIETILDYLCDGKDYTDDMYWEQYERSLFNKMLLEFEEMQNNGTWSWSADSINNTDNENSLSEPIEKSINQSDLNKGFDTTQLGENRFEPSIKV